jgi:hypothetical protein
MKPSRFTEEQIIGILREHDAGAKTATFVASTGFQAQPSISDASTADLRYLIPNGWRGREREA